VGVTPVMYYDAVGRLIRTESPDGSYSRVEFSPWHVAHYDANDTVGEAGNAWFARKSAPTASMEEQRAARLAAEHADTPSLTILDSLGREVVTIAHNRVGPANAPVNEKYVTFSKRDAEGKPLWVQDARGNRVMQYILPPLPDGVHPFNDESLLNAQGFAPCYDIAGNLLFQHSMDAGERWMLTDAAGKPMFAWNSRKFITQVTYDELHRPTASIVTDKEGSTFVAERTVYGETAFGPAKTDATARARAKQTNHLGKPYQVYDNAGIVTNISYDFKSNLIQSERRLLSDYKTQVNWPELPLSPQQLPLLLENEVFVSRTRYDALNRPIQIIAPHSTAANPQRINITQPVYNEAGLLERVDTWLNQPAEPIALLDPITANTHVVTNIDYDAKGQRVFLQYGNGSETRYDYEPDTFRLKRLKTTRTSDGALLQDLNYTYDPVGNITQLVDNANDRIYHSNTCALTGAEYRYDALYRLIAASGREHKGDGQQYDWDDSSHYVPTLPNDCQALRNYTEEYRYDSVGNIMQVVHHVGRNLEQPGQVIWNRRYQYTLDSNRLLATSLSSDHDTLPDYAAIPGYSAKYTYDLHGNMTSMSHLPLMQWDYKDQLQATAQQTVNNGGTPETTYYVYDAQGQRMRKVTERQAAAGQSPTRLEERIYLGGFEIYRKYSGDGNSTILERETLHIMDDKQRIALVETKTVTNPNDDSAEQLIRYQFGNHLGSASLELNDNAVVISYEEYYPYGSTSYQAVNKDIKAAAKRYRYTGKERDEESGLYYHGARYYAPWLGRWVSTDPGGMVDGLDLYEYVASSPLQFRDLSGMDLTVPPHAPRKEQTELRKQVGGSKRPKTERVNITFDDVKEDPGSHVVVVERPETEHEKYSRVYKRELAKYEKGANAPRGIDVLGQIVFSGTGIVLGGAAVLATGATLTAAALSEVGGLVGGEAAGKIADKVLSKNIDPNTREFYVGLAGLGGGFLGGVAAGAIGNKIAPPKAPVSSPPSSKPLGPDPKSPRYFLHGTSEESAAKIRAEGVKPVSAVTHKYPQGSFFTIEATPESGSFGGVTGAIKAHITATHLAGRGRGGYTNLRVLVGQVEGGVIDSLGKNVVKGPIPRLGFLEVPEETVFLPKALGTLNDNITWTTLHPEF
jgi:RHS repeat-associated protein